MEVVAGRRNDRADRAVKDLSMAIIVRIRVREAKEVRFRYGA